MSSASDHSQAKELEVIFTRRVHFYWMCCCTTVFRCSDWGFLPFSVCLKIIQKIGAFALVAICFSWTVQHFNRIKQFLLKSEERGAKLCEEVLYSDTYNIV